MVPWLSSRMHWMRMPSDSVRDRAALPAGAGGPIEPAAESQRSLSKAERYGILGNALPRTSLRRDR